MATAIFDGVDGDWAGAGNWSGGGGASGAPTNGDSVLVRSANVDIDTNLTSFSAISIVDLVWAPGVKVRGTDAAGTTAITFAAISGTLRYGGGGERVVFGSGGTIALAIIDSQGGTVALSSGTYTSLICINGDVAIGGSAVVTGIEVIDSIVQAAAGTAFTTSNVGRGKLYSARNLGTLHLSCGGFVQESGAGTLTAGTIHDGTLNWQSSGTVAAMTVKSRGRFTPKGAIYDFTITAHTVLQGGVAITYEPGIVITLTAAAIQYGVPGFAGGNSAAA